MKSEENAVHINHPSTGWTAGGIKATIGCGTEMDFTRLHDGGCTITELRFLITVPLPLRRQTLAPFLRRETTTPPATNQQLEHLRRCLPMLEEDHPDLMTLAYGCDQLLARLDISFSEWSDCFPMIPIPATAQVRIQDAAHFIAVTTQEYDRTIVRPNTIIHFDWQPTTT